MTQKTFICVNFIVITLLLFLFMSGPVLTFIGCCCFQTVKTYKTETLKVSKSIAQRKVGGQE